MEIIELTKKTCMLVSPARIQSMMSGVAHVEVTKHGKDLNATLVYNDGTRESRTCTREQWAAFDEFFNVVSYVQAGRV
jgi:hypothetical protein